MTLSLSADQPYKDPPTKDVTPVTFPVQGYLLAIQGQPASFLNPQSKQSLRIYRIWWPFGQEPQVTMQSIVTTPLFPLRLRTKGLKERFGALDSLEVDHSLSYPVTETHLCIKRVNVTHITVLDWASSDLLARKSTRALSKQI